MSMNAMPMNAIARTAAVLSLAVLAACDTPTGASLLNEATDAYDGAWIGVMTVGYRLQECRLTRGGLRVRIKDGEMIGQIRFATAAGDIVGLLAKDGTIAYAKLTGQYAKDDIEFVGTFVDKIARGTWSNKVCNGEWELRKAR